MLFPLDCDVFLDVYKFSENQEFGHLSTPSLYNFSTPYWTVGMELGWKMYIQEVDKIAIGPAIAT